MSEKKHKGQQQVVIEYLEALLFDPIEDESDEVSALEVQDELSTDPALAVNAPENILMPEPEPEPEPQHIQETPASVTPARVMPGLHTGLELNCVLIEVYGLKLAIPFEMIEGTVSLNTLTLSLDNDHSWILGSFSGSGKRTNIVDTAARLIPGRYDATRSKYTEIVILRGRDWALACDALLKSIRIPDSGITWNHDRVGRPWLRGTYMEERCAILDVDMLMEQFEQAF